MKRIKEALLGGMAALAVSAGAQAADMPVKAKPVQYVKICSQYGDGFYYIPGTNTCLKIGGFVRVQADYNAGAGGIAVGSGSTEAPQARFARDVTNDVNYRIRTVMSLDVRDQTEFGTLRSYIRIGVQQTTPADATSGSVYWDRAFIQWAGFTVGKTLSFFDLFTYSGAYSYHDPRVTGDTTISNGLPIWAYTADFGAGYTATLSIEDVGGHVRAPVVDATVAGFFAANGVIAGDTAFSVQSSNNNGFRQPDVVINFRVDQAWGFAGVSAALHEVGGAYWNTANSVANGHPSDRHGWAVSAGGKLNLPGGDMVGINACYSEGAAGYCTRQGAAQFYNASTSVGVGWITDGVFTTGTEVQLTRVWSVLAAYEHVWNARWRTSVFGGYLKVDYNDTATGIINSSLSGASVCARPFAGIVGTLTAIRADAGNSCNPDYGYWEVGTRTQFNPHPLLDIGFELLYSRNETAYKGPGLYAVNLPRPVVSLFDDQGVLSGMFRWQRNFYP
jgi:Porin subfamily